MFYHTVHNLAVSKLYFMLGLTHQNSPSCMEIVISVINQQAITAPTSLRKALHINICSEDKLYYLV